MLLSYKCSSIAQRLHLPHLGMNFIIYINSRKIPEFFFEKLSLWIQIKKPAWHVTCVKNWRQHTANAKDSEVIKNIRGVEFGSITWKTKIFFIKNSPNGNVHSIVEKRKNISNKNICYLRVLTSSLQIILKNKQLY